MPCRLQSLHCAPGYQSNDGQKSSPWTAQITFEWESLTYVLAPLAPWRDYLGAGRMTVAIDPLCPSRKTGVRNFVLDYEWDVFGGPFKPLNDGKRRGLCRVSIGIYSRDYALLIGLSPAATSKQQKGNKRKSIRNSNIGEFFAIPGQ